MPARDALWRDYQRTRWLKPDAHRWIKPDASRFLKPGVAIGAVLPAFEAKYSPSQPRVPAGNPRGGQWTRDRGGSGGGGGFPIGGGGGFAFGGDGGFAFGDGGDIAFDLPDVDLGSLAFDDASGGGVASIFDGFDLSDGVSLRDTGDKGPVSEFDVAAARRTAAECEFQYKQDTLICQLVGTRACWAQAAERLGACLAGRPIPALRF